MYALKCDWTCVCVCLFIEMLARNIPIRRFNENNRQPNKVDALSNGGNKFHFRNIGRTSKSNEQSISSIQAFLFTFRFTKFGTIELIRRFMKWQKLSSYFQLNWNQGLTYFRISFVHPKRRKKYTQTHPHRANIQTKPLKKNKTFFLRKSRIFLPHFCHALGIFKWNKEMLRFNVIWRAFILFPFPQLHTKMLVSLDHMTFDRAVCSIHWWVHPQCHAPSLIILLK